MFSRCQGDRHVCDCQLNLPRSNGNTRLEKTSTDRLYWTIMNEEYQQKVVWKQGLGKTLVQPDCLGQ